MKNHRKVWMYEQVLANCDAEGVDLHAPRCGLTNMINSISHDSFRPKVYESIWSYILSYTHLRLHNSASWLCAYYFIEQCEVTLRLTVYETEHTYQEADCPSYTWVNHACVMRFFVVRRKKYKSCKSNTLQEKSGLISPKTLRFSIRCFTRWNSEVHALSVANNNILGI